MTMICVNCGVEEDDERTACGNCGDIEFVAGCPSCASAFGLEMGTCCRLAWAHTHHWMTEAMLAPLDVALVSDPAWVKARLDQYGVPRAAPLNQEQKSS